MSLLFLDIFNFCSGLLLFLSSQECSRQKLISVLLRTRSVSSRWSRSLYCLKRNLDQMVIGKTHLLSHAVVNPEIGRIIKELLKFSQWISSVISHNGLDVIKLFKIKQKLQK